MVRTKKLGVILLGLLIVMASAPHLAKAVDVAPLVDQGWLLGGFSQGKWLSAQDTAKALQGGETYQLCTVTRFLGRARGSKPKPSPVEGVMPEFGVTFTPSPKNQEPVVAVGSRWNAMPRLPRLITENLQPYEEAAKEILKSKGIAEPQVNLTQVIEIDLDGDGLKEVLVCARRFTMAHLSDVLKDGDYSMVFLHKLAKGTGRNILIEGQFQAASRPEPGLALTWRVVGLVDADGDGVMEMVVNYTYYEGGGARLYQLKGEKVELVLGEDWGA
jgi:hypothetical protein